LNQLFHIDSTSYSVERRSVLLELMNKKIVITGSPGVGKTTLIEALRKNGHKCYDEPARKILNSQLEIDGPALPSKSPQAFIEEMLKDIEENYTNFRNDEVSVFFDRAFPDLYMYCSVFKVDPIILSDFEKKFIYNKIVFILPVWKDIFVNDVLRKMPFEDSFMRQEEIIKAYDRLGYNLIEVPKAKVSERVDFILSKCGLKSNISK
jgi:predicted ATPase